MSKEITIEIEYVKAHIKHKEEFIIFIVPNRFTVDYPAYFTKVVQVIGLTEKFQDAKTKEDIAAIEKQLVGLGLVDLLEDKYNLVKSVLIANDYEFDRDWWDSRVSPRDIDQFITKCVQKDENPETKKKVLALMGQKQDWITDGLLGHLTSTGGR